MNTGEAEEERVEEIVPERYIESHEEAAEAFVWASAIVLVLMLLPLVLPQGRLRTAAAVGACLGTLLVFGLGYRTGEAGGRLVYEHGAAQAYVADLQVCWGETSSFRTRTRTTTVTTDEHNERHRTERIGWLRAAVLGANDGIVSTASLLVGVAAAEASHESIMVAGVAGLVAGAMSMAAGEYVSVSSQADTENADLDRERGELAADGESELSELTAIYVERGLDESLARQVARAIDGTRCVGRARARRASDIRRDERASGSGSARVRRDVFGRRRVSARDRVPLPGGT